MPRIVLPIGYKLSMPGGNFLFYPLGNTTRGMQTIAETRRQRLEDLIREHGGLIANLNEALGYERNDTRLARIRNANARTDRPGKVFQMGDPQAREIEEKLGLERGWMDTPSLYEFADPRLGELYRVAQELEPYQIEQLITIGSTLAQKPRKDELPAQQSGENVLQTPDASPEPGKGLASVRGVVAKKIGKGHFGPPADEPNRGESGQSSRNRGKSRKGHAGGS